MTESVSLPRSRSRADRSSARSRPRPRAVAAAADNAARATARPGNATGGDAPRDERTLDLFGDPVLEPTARGPVASRDDGAMDADTAATVEDGEDDAGRQAMLDGFGTPGVVAGAVEPAPDVAKTVAFAPTPGNGDVADADVARASAVDAATRGDALPSDGVAANAAGESATDGGASAGSVAKTGDAAGTHAGRSTANARAAEGAVDAAIDDSPPKSDREPEGAAAPVTHDEAVRTPGETAAKGRRASSGSGRKRRVVAGARGTSAARRASEAAAVDAAPEVFPAQHPAPSTEPAAPAVAAIARDVARAPAAPASTLAQPVASAASFVTKPSADRAPSAASSASAFDPDTQLRPLSDRLAALQAETAGMKQAADREMRRVNRLLLALAIVVFAGLVALVLQTRQIAHLKQEVDARQQRIDRLAADLSTQQATLMTLAEHHEAMLSQVDRLQRNANREAAAAKRTRRTR
ncbi:flagellar hook-length control protein FliK [Burkholderia territorii]|uniref:Flagellar hook-length control protein FliK n=1 Tax=Burkholderia territorii TaxID=1503055 RepID=A0A106DDK0_9BURK|nr:hypothetical protein [Burkholderia territorii]KVV39534.1 flagellar hook-length control protein FliK [Burkholderia territorii]KVX27212.1 flagellar hook-length control protein FliK [Burkholderia territorii]